MRIQKKKKNTPLPFFLQWNSCTYGWERRKILRGRRGIRTDDFSSRSDTVDGTEIGIQWSDVEPSTGSCPTLNNPRYPTSDFIPCASTSYPRGGMCDPTPRSPSQPSLFAFSVHPARPRFRPPRDRYGDSIPLRPVATFDAVHGRKRGGEDDLGLSWLIVARVGRFFI